ncbi:putative membrane protein [Agromyces hippuratus]|uniref:Putative membrane protein n=1 Tax=Agromyces hippuratus TaxID=286438 RepID=A0A852WWY8_9MICO|nr:TMEM175 family protein [Agromyces hippuratus]NYG22626.1 putative membrane protein [Agromyces hippuratus]
MSTATGTAHRYERDSVEFARTFAFLDAVYAIALTLLVVNLDPPEAAAWQSLSTLLASGLGWQLLGFGISFAVIAVFWRANHRIVAGFNAITPATITANLVAIAFVVLVPFSTQGVSDAELADEPLTVTVYALNISIAVLAQSAVFFVARRDGVLRDPLPRRADTVRFIDTLTTPIVFLASIPVAYLFGTDWARYTWALLIVIGPLSGRWAARRIAGIRASAATHPAGRDVD